MARAGVYLSDVKRARDTLIAQGRRPSIDAVRAALGDTGSKTTIHKYLRELETEESGKPHLVSDAILNLTHQLAEQLKLEANVELDVLQAKMSDMHDVHEQELSSLRGQLSEMRQALDVALGQLAASQQAVDTLKEQLQAEQIDRHKAEQRNQDLSERLVDAERYQASLEEKHRHAREALEHYRSAIKEQREQEGRRHEHQLNALQAELRQSQQFASIKQEELTQLNKQAAALVAELAGSKQATYLERENVRKLMQKIDQLQTIAANVVLLEGRLEENKARAVKAEQAAERKAELYDDLGRQKAALEIELRNLKNAIALEDRLDKLDKAVFGANRSAK